MPTIAPWVIPPNYPAIMERGAALGLQSMAQAEQEAGAADRLRLAYDQLASQERRASELVQMRHEQSQAALALRAMQAESLERYRQGQLEARAAEEKRREENMLRLGEQFRERESRIMADSAAREERFESREDRLAKQFGERERVAQEAEKRRLASVMDPVQRALLNADVAELKRLEKEKEKLSPPTSRIGKAAAFVFGGNEEKIAELDEQIKKLNTKLGTYKSLGEAGIGAAPAALPTVTTQQEYDDLPGNTDYISKNGKVYHKP